MGVGVEPTFLDLPGVLRIHDDQIKRYGGEVTIRDQGLLQSAIAMPRAGFGGSTLHEFPHGMAAAYLFHIVSNHPFVDGNKRTGLAAALTFLTVNGLRLNAAEGETYDLVLRVARGEAQKDEVIEFFRTRLAPRKPDGE